MNWWRCWFGWHRWVKAPEFAGHVRRECQRCGLSQAHTSFVGWMDESASLRRVVRIGLELQDDIKRQLTGEDAPNAR